MEDEETTKALATLGVGPAAAEAYKDLLQPAARELGKNLHVVARLISAALTPLRATVWGVERISEWLSAAVLSRLAHAAPEDIQPPKPYVARPVLLQLTLCAEEEHLRDLYANLLAAAMNRPLASRVHPAFVQIIQQMSRTKR